MLQLAKTLSGLVNAHYTRQCSQAAVDFAVNAFGISPTYPDIRSIEEGNKLYGIKRWQSSSGMYDPNTNTLYLDFNQSPEDCRKTTSHEVGHLTQGGLAEAVSEINHLNSEMEELGREVSRLVRSLVGLDMRQFGAEIRSASNPEEVFLHPLHIVRFSPDASTLVGYRLSIRHECFEWYNHMNGFQMLEFDLRDLETSLVLVRELPEPISKTVLPLIKAGYEHMKMWQNLVDVKTVEEGWADFFAYTFLQNQRIDIKPEMMHKKPDGWTPLKLLRNPHLQRTSSVETEYAAYTNGFYLMQTLAGRLGSNVQALRMGLHARNTQDLVGMIQDSGQASCRN